MELRVLAVGDIVTEAGLIYLHKNLRKIKQEYKVDFVVVNGENASGVGIVPKQAEEMFDAGADVITLGNHTFNKMQIANYLDSNTHILRPANFTESNPGRGYGVFPGPRGLRIGVMNLMGRCDLDSNLDNPFFKAKNLLKKQDADIVLVDFHAEATSEKGAMAWFLDGEVSAVWGTHTHVPTADLQILPKGTGFVTDLGMTGPVQSVLGIKPEQSINLFLGRIRQRYEGAQGPCKLNSVLFTIDVNTKKCIGLERVDLSE